MSVLSEDFKNGYADGHGQAVENVRYNLLQYLESHGAITDEETIHEICDICSQVDTEYLSQ